jgi:hypothetical protein
MFPPYVFMGLIIPAVVLAGLVAGLAVGTWARRKPLIVVGALASASWGLVVAGLNGYPLWAKNFFVNGVAHAIPNYILGVVAGFAVRHIVVASAHESRRTSSS